MTNAASRSKKIMGLELLDFTEIQFMERDALEKHCETVQEALIAVFELTTSLPENSKELQTPVEWGFTNTELKIFRFLMGSRTPFVSNDTLLNFIAPTSTADYEYSSGNIVSVYVHKLRTKLTKNGFKNAILNKHGQGYGINKKCYKQLTEICLNELRH